MAIYYYNINCPTPDRLGIKVAIEQGSRVTDDAMRSFLELEDSARHRTGLILPKEFMLSYVDRLGNNPESMSIPAGTKVSLWNNIKGPHATTKKGPHSLLGTFFMYDLQLQVSITARGTLQVKHPQSQPSARIEPLASSKPLGN